MTSYKDIVTGKIRRTGGKFIGWTKPTGMLNVKYAIFQNPRGSLFIPSYCLSVETKKELNK